MEYNVLCFKLSNYCSHRLVLNRLIGQVPLLICLQLVFRSTWCSTGTKGTLPIETSTIKSVRAFKNIKSISVLSIQNKHTFYLGSQTPLIDIPSMVFSNLNRARFQQGEYNLNKKHIIIIEKHTAYVHLYFRKHLYFQVLTALFSTTFIGI